jgi:hypothetical protein
MDITTNALKWRGPTRPARWRALARPVSYAIWRSDLEVYFRALDAQEALALDAARQGATFGGVCERVLASATDDDFAASAHRAAALLQNWIRARWIVRVHS